MTAAQQRRNFSNLVSAALFVLAVAILYWGKPVLLPLAVAVLLTFILNPVVNALHRLKVPRAPAVLLVVFFLFTALGGVGWAIESQLASLANGLPAYNDNIRKKMADFLRIGQQSAVQKVQKTIKEVAGEIQRAEQISKPASPLAGASPANAMIVSPPSSSAVSLPFALNSILATVGGAGLTLVLVIFMLLRLHDLRNRVIRLVGYSRLTATTKAIDEAATRISRYLLAQSAVNAGYAACVALGLYLIGLPYATLWGFTAGVFRFIPYAGAWIGAGLPFLFSLIVFAGWKIPIGILALFLALETAANFFFEPMLYGHTAGISEVALVLAVAFWTWIWGPIGLALAAPLTVCLIVLSKYIPHFEFISLLLGGEAPAQTPLILYQRLLAADAEEVNQILADYSKLTPISALFDRLLIPALARVKSDCEKDQLTEEDKNSLLQALRQAVDALDLARRIPPTPAEGPAAFLIACPASDDIDEEGLLLLQRLLRARGCQLDVLSSQMRSAERIACIRDRSPSAICAAAVAPNALLPLRSLCERLRRHSPEAKIIAALWGVQDHSLENRDLLLASGANYFSATLGETADVISQILVLSPAETRHAA